MTRSVVGGALCWALTACIISVDPPNPEFVACERDADCPGDTVCRSLAKLCADVPDTAAPRLVGATVLSDTTLEVAFNEEMFRPDAEAATNYQISPPLSVVSVTPRESGDVVVMETQQQTAGVTYTLSVSSLRDGSGNTVDAAFASTDFIGFGTPPDTAPPEFLQPAPDSVSENLEAFLLWTARTGATSYDVEVATDAGFTNVVETVQVMHPTTSTQITGLSPITYFARVRADITAAGDYGETNFDALGDILHVFCPSGEDCSAPPPGILLTGNQTHPLWLPSAAVGRAAVLGSARINIASRDPTGAEAYEDLLFIAAPIEIYGGYDATFSELSRDPSANPTVLTFPGEALRVVGVDAPTRIDGLRFVASPVSDNIASVVGSGEDVTLSNLEFEGTFALFGSAVFVTGGIGLGPLIEDSTVTLLGPSVFGINLTEGPLRLNRVSVDIDAMDGNGTGVFSRGDGFTEVGYLVMQDSMVRVSNGRATGVDFAQGGAGEILGSTLDVGPGSGDATGVYRNETAVTTPRGVLVEGSTIITRAQPGQQGSRGVDVQETSDITVRNVVFNIGTAEKTVAVNLDTATDVLIERSILVVHEPEPTASNPDPSAGLRTFYSSNVTLRDSIVWNTGVGEHQGVRADDDGTNPFPNIVIVGNTFAIPTEPTDTMMTDFTNFGVFATEVQLVISNNIFADYGTDNACLFADPLASSIRNNAFIGCPTLLLHSGSNIIDAATLNALDGAQVADGTCDPFTAMNCETARISANVFTSQPLADVFTDFDGPDDDPTTYDDNDLTLLLLSDPQNIRGGAHDPAASDCGTQENAAPCGGSLVDSTGAARTVPYAIGAFEAP